MADTPSEREFLTAQNRGAELRRACRPITAIPDYGTGHKARVLTEAAQDAWRAEDQRIRRA